MKISDLVLYPLLSLALVLYIYFLATKGSTSPVVHKSTIRIQSLQISVTARSGSGEIRALPMPANQAQTPLLHISMYNQKPFIDEQYAFIPSERIYLVIELQNLQAGKHYLSASWKIKNGRTVSISSHDIVLQEFRPLHRTYFWLELMKNGVFTEMFTGQEYKDDAFGKWEVQVTLDGTTIAKQHFEIRDL